MIIQRRQFLSLLAAPAIVSAANIMPVCAMAWLNEPETFEYFIDGISGDDDRFDGLSPKTPWKTLQKTLRWGDTTTIHLKAGQAHKGHIARG